MRPMRPRPIARAARAGLLLMAVAALAGLGTVRARTQAPSPTVLPPWQPGTLDVHIINTGRGSAALLVLPDGTSLQFDAGDGGFLPGSPRGVPVVPDTSRRPGEWIARYVSRVLRPFRTPELDYAVVSHLHDDHMGGLPVLAQQVPIRTILDRGWPDYTDGIGPAPAKGTAEAYIAFAKADPSRMQRFEPGRADQITLRRDPASYPTFVVRNIVANGQVWTGAGTATRSRFPADWRTLPPAQQPNENESSLGIRVTYGAFDFYTGGDIPGRARLGTAEWHDIESAVAPAVGPVEVAGANHHGNRDSTNATWVSTLQPRLWILQVWSSDHPGHDVLDRMLSRTLYDGERDVLATSVHPANRLVIGPMLDRLLVSRGHIVIRVDHGGATYRVFAVDDTDESMRVTAVHGPYTSRP
jgi:beta-lactamase superfamily II metal-dependent hydrolase